MNNTNMQMYIIIDYKYYTSLTGPYLHDAKY